jgi:hypothetical protein
LQRWYSPERQNSKNSSTPKIVTEGSVESWNTVIKRSAFSTSESWLSPLKNLIFSALYQVSRYTSSI